MWHNKSNFKSKGFTLVELLGVVVLLSVLFSITYYFYNDLIKSSKEKADERSKEMIMDAVWDYYHEFMTSDEWAHGYNEDDKLSFCVSIQSLINYGYYNGDERIIEEWKDKYYVHIVLEDDGYDYEMIDIADKDVCNVTTDEVIISNQSGDYNFVDGDNNVATFDYYATKKEEFVYTIDNTIMANVLPPLDEEIKSYVTLVLDRSGSMKNQYNIEENAARELASKLVNRLDKTEISLVEYALKPYLSRNFLHEEFSLPTGIYNSTKNPNAIFHDESFTGIGGGTNTAYALTYAMMLDKNRSNDGRKFIILLYDGEPCSSVYYEEGGKKYYPTDSNWNVNDTFFKNFSNKKTIATKNSYCGKDKRGGKDLLAVSNYLKEETDITLIVVGYKNKFNEYFKKMASIDSELCNGSTYSNDVDKDGKKEWYCYYEANETALASLFDSLSSNLVKEINKNMATKIKVVLTPDENVWFYKDGIEQEQIEYVIDLMDSANNESNYSYDIKINENLFDNCTDNSCSIEIDMFNANVVYYNIDGIPIKEVELEEVPKLNLTYDRFAAIN